MMKIIVKASLLSAALFLFASTTQAQKFGYVNSAAVLSDMPEMQQMRSTLEGFQAQLKKQGEARVAAYKQKEQAAAQKKQRGEMTPKEEEQVGADLQKEQEEIYKLGQEMEQKLTDKQNELMAPILAKVNTAINDVAAEGQFQYIFDATSGVILYADPSTDLTNLVMTKLGLEPKTPTPSPTPGN
ncbi:MAG: OmpH family outer membrane protein [Saprospiraceae bacterium]|nr:MAG: OmpH family outer membrane protein [Saprospiraceae bacterium]